MTGGHCDRCFLCFNHFFSEKLFLPSTPDIFIIKYFYREISLYFELSLLFGAGFH